MANEAWLTSTWFGAWLRKRGRITLECSVYDHDWEYPGPGNDIPEGTKRCRKCTRWESE